VQLLHVGVKEESVCLGVNTLTTDLLFNVPESSPFFSLASVAKQNKKAPLPLLQLLVLAVLEYVEYG